MEYYLGREVTDVRDFFEVPIIWIKIKETAYYMTCPIEDEHIIMSLNDFPDEPLHTLYWGEQAVSFDDKPECWQVVSPTDENYDKLKKQVFGSRTE